MRSVSLYSANYICTIPCAASVAGNGENRALVKVIRKQGKCSGKDHSIPETEGVRESMESPGLSAARESHSVPEASSNQCSTAKAITKHYYADHVCRRAVTA